MTAPHETGNPLALIDQIIDQLRQVIDHTRTATVLAGTIRDTLPGVSSTPGKALLANYASYAATELGCVMGQTEAATALVTNVKQALSKPVEPGVEHPVKPPFNAPLTRDEVQAEHRRAHRSGRPGKIDGDPELQAFIGARLDTLTFAQIVSEVRANFPPDRQCSHSGLARWWQKQKTG